MSLKITMLPLGMLQTNCYIVADDATHEAIVVDPSDQYEVIVSTIEEAGYAVREIIATHTHFDHVLASQPLKEALGVPFRIHAEGEQQLKAVQMAAQMFNVPAPCPPAEVDGYLEHGEVVRVGAYEFEARYTPGHSVGHLIFVCHSEQIALVGDCIFRGSIGRTDMPLGDPQRLKQSIAQEIWPLPDATQLLCGHGDVTTLADEKRHNFIAMQLLEMPD